MTIYITHSNREYSDHTSWREIMIFARALKKHGLDVHVARKHLDLALMKKTDSLVVFCSGSPSNVVKFMADRMRTIAVIQDLSWSTIVPRHDLLITGCMTNDIDSLMNGLSAIGVETEASKLMRFPFGAVGALDNFNRYDLLENVAQYHDRDFCLSEFTYLGSAKESRLNVIRQFLKEDPQREMSWIGNVSRQLLESEINDQSVSDRIDCVGWIKPSMSVGAYQDQSVHLVVLDRMSYLELDYNRPYEMSLAGVKEYLTLGDETDRAMFDKIYPWVGDDSRALDHSSQMIKSIDWSVFE